ncbi:MAG: addiction module protein [Nitrosospira multiformis]|nr:addiction module protein [Nitrosospira multiformis]
MNTPQMSSHVRQLLEQAKSLSEDERILLADLLYAESPLSKEEWEAAWLEECERRLGEYERDEVEAVDSDEVFARLKSKYNLR